MTSKSRSKRLMKPHPNSNFEIRKCYQSKPKFNGVYSRNSLSELKDGAYIITLNEYDSIETYWIKLYVNVQYVTYFDSFVVKYISKAVKEFIGNKYITKKIYRIETFD